MRRILVAAALVACVAGAEIVDRISVRVGNRMITSSDINQRIRLAAFQNREAVDFSIAKRREAAQQLIDQRIVEREMEVGHYPRMNASERAELLVAFAAKAYGGDAAAMGVDLISYNLTAELLEEDLARQEDLLAFLGLRFRLGSDEKKADADLDAWLKDQREHTAIEYLEKALAP